MNHLRNISNESFYQWIKEIKVSKLKLSKLEVDLKFYNTKLIGCSAISYDSIKTSGPNSTNDKVIFWLIKIEELEKEIKELNQKIIRLNSFVLALTKQEQQVLELLLMNQHRGNDVAKSLGVSRNRVYEIKNSIISKWDRS
jgi:DNA-directed RNA polymerase specialized sigma subunit